MFLPVVWWAGAITACAIKPETNLLQILQVLTEKLDQPFSITYTPYTLLYALDGLSLAEIGVLCGCSKVAVYQSVEAVRKKFIKFFENRLNE